VFRIYEGCWNWKIGWVSKCNAIQCQKLTCFCIYLLRHSKKSCIQFHTSFIIITVFSCSRFFMLPYSMLVHMRSMPLFLSTLIGEIVKYHIVNDVTFPILNDTMLVLVEKIYDEHFSFACDILSLSLPSLGKF